MRLAKSQVLSPRETGDRTKDATANKTQSGFAELKMFAIKASCCVGIRDSMRRWIRDRVPRGFHSSRIETRPQSGRLLITEGHVLRIDDCGVYFFVGFQPF